MMDTTCFPLRFMPFVLAASLGAAACPAGPLDGSDARAVVQQFLKTQTAGLPGQARIWVTLPGSALPACEALEAFLPNGASAWGRVSVGLR
ncbi:MAG TPA: flagellar basal body P-ring formation protein FlgA, partial [Variovorax sp.]|nr:flagellar basal body P-ring formation protein FlgA [Variovorax sp.]